MRSYFEHLGDQVWTAWRLRNKIQFSKPQNAKIEIGNGQIPKEMRPRENMFLFIIVGVRLTDVTWCNRNETVREWREMRRERGFKTTINQALVNSARHFGSSSPTTAHPQLTGASLSTGSLFVVCGRRRGAPGGRPRRRPWDRWTTPILHAFVVELS